MYHVNVRVRAPATRSRVMERHDAGSALRREKSVYFSVVMLPEAMQSEHIHS